MAKGGRGGKRSGATGGIKPNDIIDTTSLVSARETQRSLVDETLTVFKDVQNEYGTIIGDIQLATLKKGSSALAYYDGENIAVNKAYFNDRIVDAYKQCVDSGFHPSNGNKTALQAVVAHEIGHKLTSDVGVAMGKSGWGYDFDTVAKSIVEEARKSTSHKGVIQMARKISGYAEHSNAEAIAEAFSDVYCNGSKAHSESKAIVNVLNKYLK